MEQVMGRPAQPGRYGYVVERTADLAAYRVVRECMWCRTESRVIVPAQGLWDWEHGTLIQRAFPDLSPAQREQIVTGTHPHCWAQMMGDVPD